MEKIPQLNGGSWKKIIYFINETQKLFDNILSNNSILEQFKNNKYEKLSISEFKQLINIEIPYVVQYINNMYCFIDENRNKKQRPYISKAFQSVIEYCISFYNPANYIDCQISFGDKEKFDTLTNCLNNNLLTILTKKQIDKIFDCIISRVNVIINMTQNLQETAEEIEQKI